MWQRQEKQAKPEGVGGWGSEVGGWGPGNTLSRQKCGALSRTNSGQRRFSTHESRLYCLLKAAPLAPIPLVSTYREEIGSGQAPKSTRTDRTHRLEGDSPAINCLNKITYFRYLGCPSARWV